MGNSTHRTVSDISLLGIKSAVSVADGDSASVKQYCIGTVVCMLYLVLYCCKLAKIIY